MFYFGHIFLAVLYCYAIFFTNFEMQATAFLFYLPIYWRFDSEYNLPALDTSKCKIIMNKKYTVQIFGSNTWSFSIRDASNGYLR